MRDARNSNRLWRQRAVRNVGFSQSPASVVSNRGCLPGHANDRVTHPDDNNRRENKITGMEGRGTAIRMVAQQKADNSIEEAYNDKTTSLKSEKLKNELGVDLSETSQHVSAEQLEKLQDWCLRQQEVITKTGLLDPQRIMLHDTTMSIETVVDTPEFKARSPNTTREDKLEIMRQTEEKIEQGLI